VLFDVVLGLVTDVVPQVSLHDTDNFIVSTLICVQLTTGELILTIFGIVLYST